ncbi:synaptonemal complex protein 1 [Polyergus mexicanus]|uniref:synaptonemal complex protein 1 n=1 Tax=Polyergus mexicanus TaxID=615972 RepID=UPI0038B471F7
MVDKGNSTDPPVPPRRTKRKNKPALIASSITRSDATKTTNDDTGSRQKRPLQPLLSEKCQWNESRSAAENRDPQCDVAASYSKAERFRRENCNDDIATNMIETNSPRSRDNDTIFAREIPSRIDKANDDLVPAKSAALKSPLLPFPDIALPKRRTLDKYPPLFFTLHDFEDVMCAASPWDGDKSAPSTTLEEKSSTAQILDDKDDISFRVTTTNLPFEKCLDRWRDPFDNDEFIEKLDYYRLDNNKNKSDRTKIKKSSFDSSDNDYRTSTKVRFVIDSSPSKRYSNIKIDVPCDNLQSCESVFDDEKSSKQSIASFIKLSEIREEFTNVKDRGDNLQDKLCASSAEKRNAAPREHDPFTITDTNKVDMKLKTIPQTHYDNINDEKIRKEDSNFISWNEHVSNENLRIGDENMASTITKEIIMNDEYAVIHQSKILDASSEIADNVSCFTNKSLEAVCNNEKANSAKITQKSTHREEEISLNKTGDDIKEKYIVESEKTFVNESLLSFLNNHNDDKSSVLTNNFTNGSFRIEDTRRLSTKEHKEKSDFVDSKYNREEASSSKEILARSVPVKIRRNSFLETMLSDDSIDTSINCAISTKTIVSSMSMNKELSISNESANKIRESDITKKNEDVCNFYNKTTKVDTNNQEDSKKAEKEIVKVSSTDIKSLRSENKKNKNACDVKNDVLNELLYNFSNIKLKIVSPENKKSAVKIDGDKNIAHPIAIDNGISKEKERASKWLEKSENEVCDISISTKITGINNSMTIDKKIAKENLTEINIEKRLQDLESSTYNLTIGEKIIKNKNNEVTKFNESCNIKNKTVNDRSIEKTINENISNIRAEEICVKTRVEETSEGIKSADEVKQESKKLRDIRVPKTILKKNSAKCEQQQMSTFQKRIPIGAPAIMNKIFDSREFEAIAVASRSLENEREYEINSKQTHSHSKEKTDEVITISEADDDQRRVANRSMLALLDDTMDSDDKCAIVRKTTSIIPCNNNDNNKAVTPVVSISNDQSSRDDIVTITPGKVRSFVKYYEIRGDATTVERHSKSKDKEKVIKRKFAKSQTPPVAARNSQPEVIMEGKERKGGSGNVKSNNILDTSFNKNQFSTFATKVPKAFTDNSICKTTKEESKVTKEYEKSDSHVIDKEPLAKTGAKKSVQFLGGFTVINSGTFDEDESTEIVTDNDANTLRKRQAPGIPPSRDSDGCQELIREIKKSEKLPDAEKSSFQRREAVAQIHAVTSHGKNSGINCFVSKPKTPQLIFYCTV